jgi:GT2 family glycosyltransferase
MRNEPKMLIIVVLYKSRVLDSDTFKSLIASKDALSDTDKICIWDNSPIPQSVEDLTNISNLNFCEIEYTSTPENLSLSKIYNTIIKANPQMDYVVLLDQDSVFGSAYINAFKDAQSKHAEIKMFAPLITSNGLVVSPGHFVYFNGKYWKSPKYGLVKSKNTIAIASGLIISIDAVRKVGYFEERLTLYGIDTNFMIRFSRCYEEFYVLSTTFNHDLSEFNIEDKQVKLNRFLSHKESCLINARLFSVDVRVTTRLFFVYKSLSLAIKYKEFKFLSRL